MVLCEEKLRRLLGEDIPALQVLEETSSTNALLKTSLDLPHGSVVIARRQTGGRGRLGRQFASPEGGLYLSMLLKTRVPVEQQLHLTAIAAVAVRRGIAAACGIASQIKWLNDLLVGAKKLCGILAELCCVGETTAVILGVGINCNTRREDFPAELRDSACSLRQILGHEIDPNEPAAAVIRELRQMDRVLFSQKEAYLREYAAACVTLGKTVRVLDPKGGYEALAVGIDPNGGLIVNLPDGSEKVISTGEVSIRSATGYA
ncbi:MAG: biotin--[Oscillospiraceae bacterium]|nr:biotin--[acetyl-CoA-carboxylase] ligase [Oscillospiraceae bacterium]